MSQQPHHKASTKAMDRQEEVHSDDRKLKEDFPGYPHYPAHEDVMQIEKNWRTDFSNESDTTATGSESVRDDRPAASANDISEDELKNGSDRGLRMHQADSYDPASED